jgi:glycosyltransferase involved in cell wall biosynthesis
MAIKFSVAMCTYNGAPFLNEQLASIAAQTRPPDELIVCDDHSSDDTVNILNAFRLKAGFPVRIVVNSRNLGTTENFAQAIALCSGDIIALSDQDDVWVQEKLARFEQEFAASPELGLVFSDAIVGDALLRPSGNTIWSLFRFDDAKRQAVVTGNALAVLLPGWFVTGATVGFRSEFKDLVLPIPQTLSLIHDGWIGAVISSVAQVRPIPEPLIVYRQHTGQQIGARESTEADRSIGSAIQRRNPYKDQLAITEQLLQRLTGQSTFAVAPSVLNYLKQRTLHLRRRAELPTGFRKLELVLKELKSGRYHRYSNGLRSALKDLVKQS